MLTFQLGASVGNRRQSTAGRGSRVAHTSSWGKGEVEVATALLTVTIGPLVLRRPTFTPLAPSSSFTRIARTPATSSQPRAAPQRPMAVLLPLHQRMLLTWTQPQRPLQAPCCLLTTRTMSRAPSTTTGWWRIGGRIPQGVCDCHIMTAALSKLAVRRAQSAIDYLFPVPTAFAWNACQIY